MHALGRSFCLCISRAYSVGSSLVQKRRRDLRLRLTKDLDVSSPPNPFLDTESLGYNTRVTDYIIAPPLQKLSDIVTQLAQDDSRRTDLIANIIFRAVEVVEEIDAETRAMKRAQFQTELFTSAQELFRKSNFTLFAFYNRHVIDSISSKIQPKKFELISTLITQPLLRIAVQNRSIYMDPNAIICVTGVDGFKKINDLFLIPFWDLKPNFLDKYLDSFAKNGRNVQFDIIRVFMILMTTKSTRLVTPIMPRSKWTLKRLVEQTIRKRSEVMLREIFHQLFLRNDRELIIEIIELCRCAHSITGTLKYPWAAEVIENWLASSSNSHENDLVSQIGTSLMKPSETDQSAGQGTVVVTSSYDVDKWDMKTYLVDSQESLMELKSRIFSNSSLVGISIPNHSIISITFDDDTYVVDTTCVEPKFMMFVVKRLLNDTSRRKIVYSLQKFLLDIQRMLIDESSEIHFENIVEIRGGRVRRRLEKSAQERIEFELTSVHCPEVEELNELKFFPDTQIVTREWFTETRSLTLRDLCKKWLGYDHDRKLCISGDSWDIRPLPEEYIQIAGNDSRVLVALENRWIGEKIEPIEVLSYDPFDQSNN